MLEIGFEWIFTNGTDTIIQKIVDTTRIGNYLVWVLNNGIKFSYVLDSLILFYNGKKTYLYKPGVNSWQDKILNKIFVYNVKNENDRIIVEQKVLEGKTLKTHQVLYFNQKLLNIKRILKYPYYQEWKLIGYRQPTVDKVLKFLISSLNEYKTFRAFEKFKYRGVEEYVSTYFSSILIDVFDNWLYFSEIKDSLERISIEAILKYAKEEYIWTYWIDREIAPDLDDISVHSIALNLKGYNTDVNKKYFKNYFKEDKGCYLTWIGDSLIPIRWLGSVIDNRDCDCVINVNIFRYLKDKRLCSFLKKCYSMFNKMYEKYYLDPGFWFLYFYSKSYVRDNRCEEIEIKDIILSILKKYKFLSLRQKLLISSSANILNIKSNYLDSLRIELIKRLREDGGMPFMFYTPDNFNRILPTLLFIEAIKF